MQTFEVLRDMAFEFSCCRIYVEIFTGRQCDGVVHRVRQVNRDHFKVSLHVTNDYLSFLSLLLSTIGLEVCGVITTPQSNVDVNLV